MGSTDVGAQRRDLNGIYQEEETSMSRNLSFNTRKSLCNQLGDTAGNELADMLQQLMRRIDMLERNKVDVTPIVPMVKSISESIEGIG